MRQTGTPTKYPGVYRARKSQVPGPRQGDRPAKRRQKARDRPHPDRPGRPGRRPNASRNARPAAGRSQLGQRQGQDWGIRAIVDEVQSLKARRHNR